MGNNILKSLSSVMWISLCLLLPVALSFRLSSKPWILSKAGLRMSSEQSEVLQEVASTSTSLWTSAVVEDTDLNRAVKEVVQKASANNKDANLAIFFLSTIYESSAFSTDIIFDVLKDELKNVKFVLGSTTGCPIGQTTDGSPLEVEARASISLLLTSVEEANTSFQFLDKPGIIQYLKESTTDRDASLTTEHDGISLVFATDNCKSLIPKFVSLKDKKERVKVFGAVASAVTMLHSPKVFFCDFSKDGGRVEKMNSGLVGVTLKGDFDVKTIVARSCLPVGPVYEITKYSGNEILEMKLKDPISGEETVLSPLEHLDQVLNKLPTDQSFSLKKELLIGIVPKPISDIVGSGTDSMMSAVDFYSQKPTAFDPFTGSITVTALPPSEKGNPSFQFCIRDPATARKDLKKATEKVKNTITGLESLPSLLLLLGSAERGNKVFRYQSWESGQIYQSLMEVECENKVPIAGLYSSGGITSRLPSGKPGFFSAAVLEADSVYAIITKKDKISENNVIENNTVELPKNENTVQVTQIDSEISVEASNDVLSASEKLNFNDESDKVIVTKRDPESAHPVRVGSMDYLVPEKIPQPKNVLESLVWDREKDVDRMRERFQLARALAQAKISEGKFPKRDFFKAIRDRKTQNSLLSTGGDAIPPLLIEFLRGSVNIGRISSIEDISSPDYLLEKAQSCKDILPIVAIGANADIGTFRGQFEDIESLKKNTEYPIFCNDFVVYAYQLFKAKSSGADVIKLMASVMTAQDIAYNVKIAKAIGLSCIVVVSSKPQLMEVLEVVTGLQAISVSSRNMRLWKLDPGKANRILNDPEVKDALKLRTQGEEGLMVFQEGFSSREELIQANANGVDAAFLGEELLTDQDIVNSINKWII